MDGSGDAAREREALVGLLGEKDRFRVKGGETPKGKNTCGQAPSERSLITLFHWLLMTGVDVCFWAGRTAPRVGQEGGSMLLQATAKGERIDNCRPP